MKRGTTILWIAIGVLLGIYLILFAMGNTQETRVDLLVVPKGPEGEVQTIMPLWGVIAMSFALGAVILSVFWLTTFVGRVRDRRKLQRRIARLEEEVNRLRNAPLADTPPEAGQQEAVRPRTDGA